MFLYFMASLVLVFSTNYGGMQAKPGAHGLLLDINGEDGWLAKCWCLGDGFCAQTDFDIWKRDILMSLQVYS